MVNPMYNCLCLLLLFAGSSRRQLEKDLVVIAAESGKEGEEGAMVSLCSIHVATKPCNFGTTSKTMRSYLHTFMTAVLQPSS